MKSISGRKHDQNGSQFVESVRSAQSSVFAVLVRALVIIFALSGSKANHPDQGGVICEPFSSWAAVWPSADVCSYWYLRQLRRILIRGTRSTRGASLPTRRLSIRPVWQRQVLISI